MDLPKESYKAASKILAELKGKKVGVFVDNSNLYHTSKKYRWKVDLLKLKELIRSHCDLAFVNCYVAIPDKTDAAYEGTKDYMSKIEKEITLVTKPLKYIPAGGKIIKKGDVDVEIVIDVVRIIDQLDLVIIVAGDSDYLELRTYVLKDKSKGIIFFAHEKSMAWELKYGWHLYLEDFRKKLETKTPGGKPGVALL